MIGQFLQITEFTASINDTAIIKGIRNNDSNLRNRVCQSDKLKSSFYCGYTLNNPLNVCIIYRKRHKQNGERERERERNKDIMATFTALRGYAQ